MYQLSKIKNIMLLAALLFFLSGCGGGGSTLDSASILSTKVMLKGKVIDKETGKGLEDVKVSIDASSTTTDTEGYYELSELNKNDREVVTFEKEGYYANSAITQIDGSLKDNISSSNYLEVSIDNYDNEVNYMSQNDVIIDAANSATVNIPSSTEYTDGSGNIIEGNITARIAYIDVTTEAGRENFPGEYEGKNSSGVIVLFVSYGAVSIELKDDNGNKLELSGTAIITFPSLGLAKQNIIPLWYYDYSQGLWIGEGYAELQKDGTYQGEISHLGTWSLNKPIEDDPGIYRARIVYENGDPATTVKVYTIGTNWIRTDLSTDEDGVFEIKVIPGSTFKLKAYDPTEKYEALYDGTIAPIASGEISS